MMIKVALPSRIKFIKTAILFITVLLISSCEKNQFEELLINPNKKWCYLNSGKLEKNQRFLCYMKFSANGEWENRFISNGQIDTLVDAKEEGYTWKYSKRDSVLNISQFKFKVLKYEKDTIHLLDIKSNSKALFINSTK